MMSKKKILLLLVLVSLLAVPAFAVKEVKTITYFGGFTANAVAGTPYSSNFNFVSPDGVSKLLYAKAKIRADMTTTNTRVYAKIDGEFCNPVYYNVSANIDNYLMEFDCTGVSHGEGLYEAGFQANKNIQNVYVEWEFTYMNDPADEVASIGGTEYQEGDRSRIIVQVLDSDGNPLNNESCYTTVRNSFDMKKVDNKQLTYIDGSNALYYYEFKVSLPAGVYSVDNYCNFNGTYVYAGDTFHVSRSVLDYISYYSNGRYLIRRVSGTEYRINESADVVVQLVRDGNPVSDALCVIDVFAPDGVGGFNKVIINQNMTYIDNSNGLYKYRFNGTNATGIYLSDVLCEEVRIGNILHGYARNKTGITSAPNNPLENITDAIVTVTLPRTMDVLVGMSIDGVSTSDSDGFFTVGYLGSDYSSFAKRSFSANEHGNIVFLALYEDLSAGSHTFYGRHNVTAGNLTSKVNMFASAMGDEYDNTTYCSSYQDIDTTSALTMEDIDGLGCIVDIEYDAKLVVYLTMTAKVDANNKDIYYTISIDDIDYEIMARRFPTANTYGSLAVITATEIPLSAGKHIVRGRWRVSGGTATAEGINLIAMSNQVGARNYDVDKAYISDSTSSVTLEDIDDLSTRIDMYKDGNYFSFMLLDVDSLRANKNGYFIINYNGTDGTAFQRYFASSKMGSVGVIEVSDNVSTGSYMAKGRWSTDAGNTLSGNAILVSMGWTTSSLVPRAYLASDFHVAGWISDIESSISGNFSYTNNLILGVNLSIIDGMYLINSSIFGELYVIEEKLDNISVQLGNMTLNLTELEELVEAVNLSIHQKLDELNVSANLTEVLSALSSLNDTVLAINQTLYWKIDAVETDVANVYAVTLTIQDALETHNNTMMEINQTTMSELQYIEQLIQNINMTLYNATVSITIPAEMNLTADAVQEVRENVILEMLANARIINDRIINFHNNEYCIDNNTLQHNITYEYCVGNNCRIMSDIMDEACDYGCDWDRNECIPAPANRALIIGGILAVIIIIIALFKRYS